MHGPIRGIDNCQSPFNTTFEYIDNEGGGGRRGEKRNNCILVRVCVSEKLLSVARNTRVYHEISAFVCHKRATRFYYMLNRADFITGFFLSFPVSLKRHTQCRNNKSADLLITRLYAYRFSRCRNDSSTE